MHILIKGKLTANKWVNIYNMYLYTMYKLHYIWLLLDMHLWVCMWCMRNYLQTFIEYHKSKVSLFGLFNIFWAIIIITITFHSLKSWNSSQPSNASPQQTHHHWRKTLCPESSQKNLSSCGSPPSTWKHHVIFCIFKSIRHPGFHLLPQTSKHIKVSK